MVLVIVLHSGVPPPADEECDTVGDAPTPQAQCIDNYVPEILQIY